jgi:hypothetical protein
MTSYEATRNMDEYDNATTPVRHRKAQKVVCNISVSAIASTAALQESLLLGKNIAALALSGLYKCGYHFDTKMVTEATPLLLRWWQSPTI